MRILPIISVEEWITDEIRFFIRKTILKNPLAKISFNYEILLENLRLNFKYIGYEKITLNVAIKNIIKEIKRKKNITIILNEFIDIKVASLLRKLDYLKKNYNINLETTQQHVSIINSYENFFSNNKILSLPKGNLKLKNIFIEKLINYHNNLNTHIINFEFNLNTLINALEGFIYFIDINKFIINAAYNKFIPMNYEKFIIDKVNQALFLNSKIKPKLINNIDMNLFIGMDININKNIKEKIFTLTNNQTSANILLPFTALINDTNMFIDLFGNIKKSHLLLLNQNRKTIKNIIGFLIYKLYKN